MPSFLNALISLRVPGYRTCFLMLMGKFVAICPVSMRIWTDLCQSPAIRSNCPTPFQCACPSAVVQCFAMYTFRYRLLTYVDDARYNGVKMCLVVLASYLWLKQYFRDFDLHFKCEQSLQWLWRILLQAIRVNSFHHHLEFPFVFADRTAPSLICHPTWYDMRIASYVSLDCSNCWSCSNRRTYSVHFHIPF